VKVSCKGQPYAIQKLSQVPGLSIPFSGIHFKEFVVDFNGSGQTVASIHKGLLSKGIFGGKDLSTEFPALGQCALYAVTEIHTQADIDRLAARFTGGAEMKGSQPQAHATPFSPGKLG